MKQKMVQSLSSILTGIRYAHKSYTQCCDHFSTSILTILGFSVAPRNAVGESIEGGTPA